MLIVSISLGIQNNTLGSIFKVWSERDLKTLKTLHKIPKTIRQPLVSTSQMTWHTQLNETDSNKFLGLPTQEGLHVVILRPKQRNSPVEANRVGKWIIDYLPNGPRNFVENVDNVTGYTHTRTHLTSIGMTSCDDCPDLASASVVTRGSPFLLLVENNGRQFVVAFVLSPLSAA